MIKPPSRKPLSTGRQRRPATPDDPEALGRLLATSALLTVQRGGAGARYLVNADRTMVGRHPGSDIFLDDATVSRRHALFERRGTEYWVHDQGSLNGTYVNGERIETVRLVSGDQIQIGKFPMTFQQAPAAGTDPFSSGVPASPVPPADPGAPLPSRQDRPQHPGGRATGPGPAGGDGSGRAGPGPAGGDGSGVSGTGRPGDHEADRGSRPGWWGSVTAWLRRHDRRG